VEVKFAYVLNITHRLLCVSFHMQMCISYRYNYCVVCIFQWTAVTDGVTPLGDDNTAASDCQRPLQTFQVTLCVCVPVSYKSADCLFNYVNINHHFHDFLKQQVSHITTSLFIATLLRVIKTLQQCSNSRSQSSFTKERDPPA
jgi:hypothetical protein